MNRRRFLAGLGGLGGAIAAPWFLRPLGASAQSEFPKRIVFFCTPNGTDMDMFWEGTGTDLGRIHAALNPIAHKVLRLRGIDNEAAHEPEIPPNHQPDWNTALTGLQARPDTRIAEDLSVDQFIANALNGATPHRSLHFGAQPHGGGTQVPSWTGRGERVRAERDPYAAFDQLFADFTRPADRVASDRARQRSVLDTVLRQSSSIECAIGSEFRPSFANHLEEIRNLERSLDPSREIGGACAVPSVPRGMDPTIDEHVPEVTRAHLDLLRMSLACDLTRVATFQLGADASQIRTTWMPTSRGLHSMNHGMGDSDEVWAANILMIERWFAEQFAYLALSLDAIPEGEGTLLDNTMLVWVHEQAVGRRHIRRDVPYVIAGGANHGIVGGRKKSFDGQPHNQLLVALANSMDVECEGNVFGNPAYRGVLDLS